MKTVLESVAQAIRAHELVRRGERLLVAVSGGVDSMVLLQLLQWLAGACGWQLFVAHFNHQLRGRASAADEALVRRTAAALGCRFVAGRGDVKGWAQRHGVSLEMAARELRHQFLARTARRLKCPGVAVAHHADDQVELFFLRLLRGAGGAGLAGMKWRSVSPADAALQLVRPLLGLSKAELVEFAREHKIRSREDASNASRDILRNRVRHELLPLLEQNYQPALPRTVLRLMDVVGAEAEAVGAWAEQWLAATSAAVDFGALAVAVQRQVIQRQLQRLKILPDFELIETLRRGPGVVVAMSATQSVVCTLAGRVSLVPPKGRAFKIGKGQLDLQKPPGSATFAGLEIRWKIRAGGRLKLKQSTRAGEFFDAEQVGRRVILRHWRPGDRFQPIGMKVAVKLQDWFTNQKIPAGRRRELVVATTERGEIFWVEGLRIGERFKLTPQTRKCLHWRWAGGAQR